MEGRPPRRSRQSQSTMRRCLDEAMKAMHSIRCGHTRSPGLEVGYKLVGLGMSMGHVN